MIKAAPKAWAQHLAQYHFLLIVKGKTAPTFFHSREGAIVYTSGWKECPGAHSLLHHTTCLRSLNPQGTTFHFAQVTTHRGSGISEASSPEGVIPSFLILTVNEV